MFGSFLRNHSSTILACIGGIGVVATAISAVKSTPKAIELLDKAKEEKGEELTKPEIIKTAAPAYIPSLVLGASTIACIFGIDMLRKHQQAALLSAYALLDTSYKQYRRKVSDILGEEVANKAKEEIEQDTYTEVLDEEDELNLFFDFDNMRYFRAPLNEVVQKVTTDDGTECYIINTQFDPI